MLPYALGMIVWVALVLWASHRKITWLEWLAKPAAALTFIAAAVAQGALTSRYGQVLAGGLVLAAIGDVLLIPKHRSTFLAGLIAFLLGHVAYGVAFLVRGIDSTAFAISLAIMIAIALPVLRWLWPHVRGAMRPAVGCYVVVITTMVALAIATYVRHGDARLPIGAFAFYLSDLSVARNRFVKEGFVNRAWGLPLYFASQLVLGVDSSELSARDQALAIAHADPAVRALLDLVRERQDGDPGHDVEHALRVGGWMLRLAPRESPRECIAAALLHDVINVPKDDPRRAQASALCAEEAARILERHGFSGEAIARIAEAIEDHSYSRGAVPRSALGDALQDADRLEALGALGLMRTFSCGARMGAQYFHAQDPFGKARALDDRRYSVDHFFTKLLGLPETMRTAAGREEGQRRVQLLRAFLAQLATEIGTDR